MPDKLKKAQRADTDESLRGRQSNHQMKPYLVMDYLRRESDYDNLLSIAKIEAYFRSDLNIVAERRSIYRDIAAINKTMLMLEEGIAIDEAEEMLEDDEDDELKVIVYDKHRKGYYFKPRQYSFTDIRLLAESIYSARFLTEAEAKYLVDFVCGFVSENQADKIRHDAFLTNRVKTENNGVLDNIERISTAMSDIVDGRPHVPEKITFKYLKYSIADMKKQVERRQGNRYTVSPYHFIINDGNYYLLAYDDRYEEMRTYRVDRMRDVRFTGEARSGEGTFAEIDLKSYTARHFSMFGGDVRNVSIQAINPLLDTMVDRFGNGKQNAVYSKVDDTHFRITVRVEVSDQFFGWLLGFGKKVKLISPDDVVEKFKSYLDKIRESYE